MKTIEWQGHPSGTRCVVQAPHERGPELDALEASMLDAGVTSGDVFLALDTTAPPTRAHEGRVYDLESFVDAARALAFDPPARAPSRGAVFDQWGGIGTGANYRPNLPPSMGSR